MPRVVFTLHPTGQVEIRVEGVQGPGCHQLTRDAEAALGPAQHRERTREFYATAPQAPRVNTTSA